MAIEDAILWKVGVPIVVCLAGVVAFLWRTNVKMNEDLRREMKTELLACEKKHQETAGEVLDIRVEYAEIKGQMHGLRDGVDRVVDAVLSEVRSIKEVVVENERDQSNRNDE